MLEILVIRNLQDYKNDQKNEKDKSPIGTNVHKKDVPNFIHSTPRENSSKHFTRANEQASAQPTDEHTSPDISIEDCNGAKIFLQNSLSKEDFRMLENGDTGVSKKSY